MLECCNAAMLQCCIAASLLCGAALPLLIDTRHTVHPLLDSSLSVDNVYHTALIRTLFHRRQKMLGYLSLIWSMMTFFLSEIEQIRDSAEKVDLYPVKIQSCLPSLVIQEVMFQSFYYRVQGTEHRAQSPPGPNFNMPGHARVRVGMLCHCN